MLSIALTIIGPIVAAWLVSRKSKGFPLLSGILNRRKDGGRLLDRIKKTKEARSRADKELAEAREALADVTEGAGHEPA